MSAFTRILCLLFAGTGGYYVILHFHPDLFWELVIAIVVFAILCTIEELWWKKKREELEERKQSSHLYGEGLHNAQKNLQTAQWSYIVSRLQERVELSTDFLDNAIEMTECRGDEDCDHCLAIQLVEDNKKVQALADHWKELVP